MKQIILWNDLIDILTGKADKDNRLFSISIIKAISFLLGENIFLDETEYYKIKKNPMKLSVDNKQELLKKVDWELDKIIPENAQEEVKGRISECYKQTMNQDTRVDMSVKIKQLVFLSVFGTIYPAVFQTRNIKNSYKTNSNYIERPDVIQNIRKCLSTNNILIVIGEPAIGKTQAILEYIQKSNYKEVAWFEGDSFFEQPLKRQMSNGTEILTPADITIETALGEKSSETLIVIERTVLKQEDYDYINNEFSGKKLHIIMVTRSHASCKISCETSKIIHLERLSAECLLEMFKNYLVKKPDFFKRKEFDSLLQIIDSNTLVVALLGKSLNKFLAEKRSDEEEEDIKKKLLDSKKWIWKDKSLPNINQKNYMHSPSTDKVIYFIRSIISRFRISDDDKLRYAELALWVRGTIAVSDLNSWCTDEISKSIDGLVDLGIAEYVDDGKSILKIHPFISDVLWSEFIQNPRGWEDRDKRKAQLKPIMLLFEENISKFLDKFRTGKSRVSSYTMLYNTAETLIRRVRMEISFAKEDRVNMEDWESLWKIEEQIFDTLIKCGNTIMAWDIIQGLYFYDFVDPEGKKLDDKNKAKLPGLDLKKVHMDGADYEEWLKLTKQIPKNFPYESGKVWHEEWTELLRSVLNRIACEIEIKGIDSNFCEQDKTILEMLTCFKDCLSLLYDEYIRVGNQNDIHIGYFCSILCYLQALFECYSRESFLEEVTRARCYYKIVLSQIYNSDRDFRLIVNFTHIHYECFILIKELQMVRPNIQEVQKFWNTISNLFRSEEKEFKKHMCSKECLESYQKACLLVNITEAFRNPEILTDTVDNMRQSFLDQIHMINKEVLDKIRAIYDNAWEKSRNMNRE